MTRLSELAGERYERSIIDEILTVIPEIDRRTDLSDVLQDVYARLVEDEAKYDEGRASPHTFIRLTARRVAQDWVRARNTGIEMVPEAAFEEDGRSYYDELVEAGPEADPFEQVQGEQVERMLDRVADAVLTDGEVSVYLGMKAGLTPKEIADDTGFTVSSVYVLRNRVRNKLKYAC